MNERVELSDISSGGPVLVFDSVCVLCTGFAKFLLEHDRKGVIRFASAQGDIGQDVYRRLGLDTVEFETNVLVRDGKAYLKSEAFIETMSLLGMPWSLCRLMRLCPRFIRDAVYVPIARNRYRVFGKREECYLPTADERARFMG